MESNELLEIYLRKVIEYCILVESLIWLYMKSGGKSTDLQTFYTICQIHDTKLMIIIIIVISFLVVMALSVAVVWYIYKARDIKAERDLALVRNMQIDIESSEIVSRFRIPGYYPTTEDINRLKEILKWWRL